MNQLVQSGPIAAAEPERAFASTEAQREVWTAAQLGNDASCAFNEALYLRLRGRLDLAALRQAIDQTVEHHEALRATFRAADGQMRVAHCLKLDVPYDDLTTLPADEAERQRRAAMTAEVETAFDLENGPLLRMRVLRVAAEEHWLLFTAHHIVCDGWSLEVVLRDLGCFYSAACAGTDPVVPPADPYSEYARVMADLEAQPGYQASLDYWVGQFRGDAPVLELPLDRRRPAVKTYTSHRYDHALPPELVQALKRASAKLGMSFFNTLLAGFAAFLHRISGETDLVVGVPVAGQAVTGLANVVGHCVNFMPVRCRIEPAEPFAALARQVRSTMLDAYDHQQVTFGKMLQHLALPRDVARNPLVAVMFNLDQALERDGLAYADLDVYFDSNPRHYENFEIMVNAAEEPDGRLVLETQYNTDLFDEATIRDRLESFETLLRGVVADASQLTSRLPILSLAQQQTLADWNATTRDFPSDRALSGLLEEQACRVADKPAIVFGAESVTYAELQRRANRLAHHLRSVGVGPGTLVGLCTDRTPDMIVALLAIHKAGGGYLPLDPDYPRERLNFMLTDARAAVLVTQERWLELFPASEAMAVCLDRDAAVIAAQPAEPLPCPAGPGDVAYVIYTSGSTGKPKGVSVPHAGVVNFLASMARWPGMTETDVMLAVTTLSFDIAVAELLLPLSVGATVVLASRDAVIEGHELVRLLRTSGATILQGTPSLWRLLLQAGWEGAPTLSAWTGGEALPADLARALLARTARVCNLYGPTETTVWSTGWAVTDPDQVRIGKPFDNTQVYVLDANREPVPVGVVGELYIGGAGVTHGYLNRPELTAERFVENPYHDPFADYLNPRLYRTGDLVRWRPDGTLECLGRNDHQVKLRGYRIELAEIEAVLARLPAVRQAVVVLREDRAGDARLVAYVVPQAQQAATPTELRRFLRGHLPEYMVPQHFVDLEALPLTNNGKIDRARLPAPFAAVADADTFAPPATATEQYLAGIWQEILSVPRVGVEDNFFNLGGYSLLAFQVLARIDKEKGVRLPPRALVLNTLGQLAQQLETERTASNGASVRPRKEGGIVGKLRGLLGSA